MPHLSDRDRGQFAHTTLGRFALTGRLTITSDCPLSPGIHIFDPDKFTQCAPATPALALGSPIDSRAYYYITGDPLCSQVSLPRYVYTSSLADFQLGTLSDAKFCSTWLYSP